MNPHEEWRSIRGYEGRYEVSSLGRVRSLPRKYCPAARILRERLNKCGYVGAALYSESGPRTFLVHRLVCLAFLGDPPSDRPDVNHIDGDKRNNALENLEWTNDRLNHAHAIRVLGVKRRGGRPWLGKFGASHVRSKPLIRTDSDGAEVQFAGVMDAARGTPGACFKKISAVCLGKRPRHLGYQWRYISGDSQ